MMPKNFFLGTHHPAWLSRLGVPLCVSRRRLVGRKGYPRATARWMLDSGAFSEIAQNGAWTVTARDYAREVEVFRGEIGALAFVAPQDWMCEPNMLKKTGLTVRRHQELTTDNYLALRALGVKDVFPVLQGWTIGDYFRHADQYERRGVALAELPVVGIGSVCRRQAEDEISQILHEVAERRIRLHGFGVKMQGIVKAGAALHSADSMAWSFSARRRPPLPGCVGHINCANCEVFALRWRTTVLELVAGAN